MTHLRDIGGIVSRRPMRAALIFALALVSLALLTSAFNGQGPAIADEGPSYPGVGPANGTFTAPTPPVDTQVSVWDPPISVIVSDTVDLRPAQVKMYIDGSLVPATVVFPRGHWEDDGCSTWYVIDDYRRADVTYQPPMLEDGTHTVEVVEKNKSDLTDSFSWDIGVSVAPQISGLAPKDGTLPSTQTPTIGATIEDNGTGPLDITLTLNSEEVTLTEVSPDRWEWTPSEPLPDDTEYACELTVEDDAGLVSTASWAFRIEIYPHMPVGSDCSECHPTYPVPDHPTDDCVQCHNSGDGHGRMFPETPLRGCSCHSSAQHDPDRLLTWECSDCHRAQYPWIPRHSVEETRHITAQDMTDCRPCHVAPMTREHYKYTDDLGAKLRCQTCHESTQTAVVEAIATQNTRCDACHEQALHITAHDTGNDLRCSGCHGEDIATTHVENEGLTCDTCHSSTAPAVEAAIDSGDAHCADCHDVLPDTHAFDAPTVELKRCRACHWYPAHWQTTCIDCHPQAPEGSPFYSPEVYTAYGYFESLASLEATAGELHDIHVNGSWVAGRFTPSGCDSCHAQARCEACHSGKVPHKLHTRDMATRAWIVPPVREVVAEGTPEYGRDTTRPRNQSCVVAPCHPRGSLESTTWATPDCRGCHP